MTTSLAPRAAARLLASLVARVLHGSAAGPVRVVPFGDACCVSVGDCGLATLSPSDGGVDVEWSPYGEDVRSFLAPLFVALAS